MAARGFLGAGDLYIARYNPTTNTFDDFVGPLEGTKFEIKPNTEIKELSSRGRSTYGQVIESVPLNQPADFTVDMPEVNKSTLLLALMGTESVINQTAGTITAQELAVTSKDAWLSVGKENLLTLTVKNEAGTTTYVAGTDYELNKRLGWIKIKGGSAIAKGDKLNLDGTYGDVTGAMISGATQSQIRAKFRLDGVNQADRLPVIVDVHEAVIAADSAFDFLADDFATLTLTGRLKTPAGKAEPFTVKLGDVAID